jgi:hypothetical protein
MPGAWTAGNHAVGNRCPVGVAKGAPQHAVLIPLPNSDGDPQLLGTKAPGRQQNLHVMGRSLPALTGHLSHGLEEALGHLGAFDDLPFSPLQAQLNGVVMALAPSLALAPSI